MAKDLSSEILFPTLLDDNHSDNNTCYICLEDTELKSPCQCESLLCDNCLKILITDYNKTNCSICKFDFNDNDYLNNIESGESFEIDLEYLDYDLEEECSRDRILRIIFKIFLSILIIIFFGNLFFYSYICSGRFIIIINIPVIFIGTLSYLLLYIFYISFC